MQRNLIAIFVSTHMILCQNIAKAETPGITVTSANGNTLDPGQLYAVQTTCTEGADLPQISNRSGWKALFPSDKKAISFYVSVQSTPLVVAPSLSDQLKSSMIIAFSFAADQSKQILLDNRNGGSCNQATLAYGQTALYVVPALAYTNQFSPGAIGTAFDDIFKAVASLAPVFGAAATGGAIKSIGDVSGAISPISDLVSQFDSANTDVQAQSTALTVGDTIVSTSYSTIKINVRPIDSVIKDQNSGFRVALRLASVASVGPGVTAIDTSSDTSLQRSCGLVANKLAAGGFSSSLDQDYGIIHAAAPVITNSQDMASCLGINRVNEIAAQPPNIRKIMYEGVNLRPVADPQPQFSDIQGSMDLLTQQMGRYVKLTPPQNRLSTAIGHIVLSNVKIQDPLVIFDQSPPGGVPAAIDFLRDQGYHHIGFFAQVTSAMLAYQEYHVVVGIVAIKADATASSGCYANSLALYPHFDAALNIDKITVSNDVDEIKALVGNRNTVGDNGFSLSDCPAAAPPPAIAKPN